MVDLDFDKPLKRGIPNSPYYVELYGTKVVIKTRGSRKSGVTLYWSGAIENAVHPANAPAKIRNAATRTVKKRPRKRATK